MMYAQVVVDITADKLDRPFTYRIPEHLRQVLRIGMEVKVPFGRGNRPVHAYVIGLTDEPPVLDGSRSLKEILEIPAGRSAAGGTLIELAAWMAEHYGSTMIQALKTVLPAKDQVRTTRNRFVRLKAEPAEAKEALESYLRRHQNARARLLSELLDRREIPYAYLREKLHVTKETLDHLVRQGLAEVTEASPVAPIVAAGHERKKNISLNPDQIRAAEAIRAALQKQDGGSERTEAPETFLLYGVTGSGKTEVYMHAIEEAVRLGGQAIVLIPEIALTYQTVMRFHHRFGDRVSIMHSRLSKGERYAQFERARKGEIDVIIGPRSALFTPMPRLKLIVIDEEQERTYKSENTPRYHARETAIYRAGLEHAVVVLGSATPSMESFLRAARGTYTLLTLPARAGGQSLAHVSVVDLRAELRSGNRTIISAKLDEAIRDRLAKKQQIMLFLNRRGYAGFVSCRACGHVIGCEHCDVSMSLHRTGPENAELVCHYCGALKPVPKVCPKCGSGHIGAFLAGTQQVEKLLHMMYPQARILRMDFDTTRSKEGHTRILSAFGNHEADILIGTQMIVKGHDFPGVTLVGILAADLSLNLQDFRAAEYSFQLLAQAAGRAGRAGEPGEVMIQTYEPDHYAIRYAAAQDYEAFFEEEYRYRELLGYPPAGHLMQVLLSGTDEKQLALAADYLVRFGSAITAKNNVRVIGPAVPEVGRVQDRYRKVIYYKHPEYDILVKIKNSLDAYISVNSGYDAIRVQYDLD